MFRTRILCAFVLVLVTCWVVPALSAEPITFDSLLSEMTDRSAVASFPDPAYTCKQASSYDRGSKAPNKSGWFANNDRSFFLRSEKNQGREEWVMMDAEGPGAIVRFWVTSGRYLGTVRVYLDGSDEPAIEAKVDDLVGGSALVGPPLSEELARGRNLYLPIPYAKHCKVTFDRPNFQVTKSRDDLIYYQINYRTYAPEAKVVSFSMDGLEKAEAKIAKLQTTLTEPAAVLPADCEVHEGEAKTLGPGEESTKVIEGPGAVCRMSVRLEADDRAQALRSTVLVMDFDGEQTVWCPLGDFAGSGVGVNPYTGWYRKVSKDGTLTCWWVMPYEKACTIRMKNLGDQTVSIKEPSVTTCPWTWDDRSMHFHANWRQQRNIETEKNGKAAHDWSYLASQGQGVYVGDTLALVNRDQGWWGEGDEKIYVDNERFPSHFGTGSEDYYGYAWCTPKFFESAFHAQPRAEGPRNFGNVTNTRVRLLDAIPFHQSFKFDMEVWHWSKTDVDYAATTYWYGRPGATTDMKPAPEEAKQPVKYKMR